MSIPHTLARLHMLADQLPRPGCDWETRPTFGLPTQPETIAEFERAAGFTLPPDVLEFLATTNSIVAMDVHNGYHLGDVALLLRSTHRGDYPRVIGGLPAIAIATDGGGNAFLLESQGHIWRWNAETKDAQRVAHSFVEFLERVADDWAAYISDRSD